MTRWPFGNGRRLIQTPDSLHFHQQNMTPGNLRARFEAITFSGNPENKIDTKDDHRIPVPAFHTRARLAEQTTLNGSWVSAYRRSGTSVPVLRRRRNC